ncbi:hypothetical protein WJX84_004198 [Apatococcus fuscideae]|uniref:Uncharacterized protein n=1 Tax=Apatococcus fuscideae TaxID=2026836 RepID=A0AAW1SQP1_9CHLO
MAYYQWLSQYTLTTDENWLLCFRSWLRPDLSDLSIPPRVFKATDRSRGQGDQAGRLFEVLVRSTRLCKTSSCLRADQGEVHVQHMNASADSATAS